MAETAISAIGSILYLLERVVTSLREEVRLQEGLGADVESIKNSLETMEAYLKDVAGKEICEVEKNWVSQVRNLVYEMEDVLDDFMFHVPRLDHRNKVHNLLYKQGHYLKHWNARRDIASRINILETKMHKILNAKPTTFQQGASSSITRRDSQAPPYHIIPDEEAIMGIEKPRMELLCMLINSEPSRMVISVSGPGGLGKTTLVKRVYNSPHVKKHFESHAWIVVDKSFDRMKILQEMVRQLYKGWTGNAVEGIDNMVESDLHGEMKMLLENRRYVIVFDDVWNINFCTRIIRENLPDNGRHSRVLITTRKGEVATALQPPSHVFNLQPLTHDVAFNLFCTKAFQSNQERQCPEYLKKLSEEFVKKCEGLPFAIVAIGEFLSKKDLKTWKVLSDKLGYELERNPILESMASNLSLCYNDLPYSLKYCFWYFGVFPDYHPIKRTRLVRLWIAEGFVRNREASSLEDVAEEYLNELIGRNLVKVVETDFDGRPRSCRVDAIMRLIILSKCKEENFISTGSHERQDRFRLLSIDGKIDVSMDFTYTRSLFMFNVAGLVDSSWRSILSRFKSLRVLDLEGAPINKFPEEVEILYRLRYLSLRDTTVSVLPKKLVKFRNLETLDLKHTNVTELPAKLFKLQRLRQLLFTPRDVNARDFDSAHGLNVSSGIKHLISLQKLSLISVRGSSVVGELGSLTQLRKLGITDLKAKDANDLCMSIQKMQNLLTLNVTTLHQDDSLDLRAINLFPPNLQRLCLKGRLCNTPHWISSLHYVVRIGLKWSKLNNSPLNDLHDLPNLMELKLVDAYNGGELHFVAKGFQELKILELDQLNLLNSVIMEEGTLPSLQKLIMRSCQNMKKVPEGFIYLKNLKELQLYDMPQEFVNKLEKDDGEDRSLVWHIPTICSHSFQSDGTWYRRDLS